MKTRRTQRGTTTRGHSGQQASSTQQQTQRPGGQQHASSTQQQTQQQTQHQSTFKEEMHLVPPGSMFTLGGIGIAIAVLANFWQVFTSFTAFVHVITTGTIYQGLDPAGKAAAFPVIMIVSALIAVSFQIAILFLVFRIDHAWKMGKAQNSGRGMVDVAKFAAVMIVQHGTLLFMWAGLGFLVDTIGDYLFISLYTDNPFVIFAYASALYASSTLMLTKAIEFIWAGKVAWEHWKQFKLDAALKQERLRRMRDRMTASGREEEDD